MVACGIAYNGTEKEYKYRITRPWTSYMKTYDNYQRWDKMEQVQLDYELTGNCKIKIAKWNISIQKWLQHTVYERLLDADHKKYKGFLGTNITLQVSAFWHGFYPCYYACFVHMGFVDHLAKCGFKFYNGMLKPY